MVDAVEQILHVLLLYFKNSFAEDSELMGHAPVLGLVEGLLADSFEAEAPGLGGAQRPMQRGRYREASARLDRDCLLIVLDLAVPVQGDVGLGASSLYEKVSPSSSVLREAMNSAVCRLTSASCSASGIREGTAISPSPTAVL